MPNDAKLGLIVGVGLVIAVSLVFFQKEKAPDNIPTANLTSPVKSATSGSVTSLTKNTQDKQGDPTAAGQRHTVQEGDTLYTLAQRYYGDKDKYSEILKVNRSVLTDGESLTPGTVLTIPDLQQAQENPPNNSGS